MSLNSLPDAKVVLSAVASIAASAMVVRTFANEIIPEDLTYYFSSRIQRFLYRFSSVYTIVIEEYQGYSRSKVFEAVETYLATKVNMSSVQRVKLGNAENERDLVTKMDNEEELVDDYDNTKIRWKMKTTKTTESRRRPGRLHFSDDMERFGTTENRFYELTFDKKHKEKVLKSYLPCILEKSKGIQQKSRLTKLHTVQYGRWYPKDINLDHPMTFDTLAMDTELKNALVEDLDNFVNGKEYYRKIGRAWKRGYLLYGPPGTGKSSLIAAMANYLKYDIYNVDLTAVEENSQLMTLLLGMSNRSILVVEDIDCNIKLQNREPNSKSDDKEEKNDKVTLSGLLNFVDGLYSCCGEQHIIIFTTNHKDKLDPALVRPGRMDMHIHMSYCTYSAFKQLASNYLNVNHHHLFSQIEGLLGKAEVTPAEVAGELIKSKHADASLQGLLNFLRNKKAEKDQMNAIDKSKPEGEEVNAKEQQEAKTNISKEER